MAGDKEPLHRGNPAGATVHQEKGCTGFCCYKILVIIYGFFVFILGLLLLGLGLWIESVREKYEHINDVVRSPSIMAIIVGGAMVIFALCGIIGAIKESLILLRIFLVAIIIIFILQVIIGIIAFVYREETSKVANDQLVVAIQEYHESDVLASAVDHIQRKYDCCGLKDPNSWNENEEYSCDSMGELTQFFCSVPASCCRDESKPNCGIGVRRNTTVNAMGRRIHTQGCSFWFRQWVESHLDVVGATALGFAMPQILGIFLIYTLAVKVEDRRWILNYRKREAYYLPKA